MYQLSNIRYQAQVKLLSVILKASHAYITSSQLILEIVKLLDVTNAIVLNMVYFYEIYQILKL